MKLVRLFTPALFLLFTISLCAATPPGKTQLLTSPEQVPEGLAKSDWHSIRAAYEAGQHAFQPIDGGWQARIRGSGGRRSSTGAALWPRRGMAGGPGGWS